MNIRIVYTSVDRFREARTFKTIEGARKFAHNWVGAHPEIGLTYAISGDGIGKVTVSGGGCTLADLFPDTGVAEMNTPVIAGDHVTFAKANEIVSRYGFYARPGAKGFFLTARQDGRSVGDDLMSVSGIDGAIYVYEHDAQAFLAASALSQEICRHV